MSQSIPHLGLDLAEPIHSPLNEYIWILATTKYFIKWAKEIPLKKVMGVAIANSIKEHIIRSLDILYKIISDNNISYSYQFLKASPMKH